MSDLIGKTLGHYEIIERIGQGGMAEVYKGYQRLLDRYVAVKVLHAFMLTEVGSQERFQREARAVAALRHPNIVQVFDFDTANNIYFMIMEYIDGPNLKSVVQDALREDRLLDLERITSIFSTVGGALGYAHSRGMIHRDVKPQNIIFTTAGQPLLADFGIAKILNSTSISDPNTVSGTPAYMSPEQAQGAPLDARADLYSLGVVLYELLTGTVPFEADTALGVLYRHINEPPPLPHVGNPAFPLGLEQVLLKALAKSPDDRYQTAEELVKAFQQAAAEAQREGAVLKPVVAASPVGARSPLGPQPTPGRPPIPAVAAPRDAGATPPTPASPPPPPPGNMPPSQITPPNRIRAADTVTIRLATPTVSVEAGGPTVENSAVLSNPRQEADSEQYNFEIGNLDPSWYVMDTKSVLLWRGDSSQVGIKFKVPRRSTVPGVYIYHVRATSNTNPDVAGYTTGRLVVSSSPTLQMNLQPATVTGEVGQYTVELSNGPVGASIVQLESRDTSGALEFTVNPPRLRLGPNEDGQVTLEVGVRPDAVGEPRSYPFTIVAKVTGGEEGMLPIEAQAELVYVPPVRLGIHVEFDPWDGSGRDFRMILTNPTSLTLDVILKADDQDDSLDFLGDMEKDHLQIGREQTVTAKGFVRLAQGLPTTRRVYPFSIAAKVRNVDGPGELEERFEGEIVYEPPAPEVDLLDAVRLTLTPTRASGDPARYTIGLQNTGAAPVLTILRAFDPADALEFACDPPQVYLEPGKPGQASLTVRRNAEAQAPPSQTVFPFKVVCGTPGGKADRLLTAAGEYEPAAAQPAFQAFLIPVEPSGMEGTYDVRLVNGGSTPVQVVLRGRDTSGLLAFNFAPPRTALAPASEQRVRVTVRTNALEPLSEEHTYPFDVICWIPGTNQAYTLRGELLYISF